MDTFSNDVPVIRMGDANIFSSNIVITNSDIGSERAITAMTMKQYWRGDKAWRGIGSSASAAVLTGLSTNTNTAIAAKRTILSSLGKVQARINNFDSITTAEISSWQE
jgi:hypothetical protein